MPAQGRPSDQKDGRAADGQRVVKPSLEPYMRPVSAGLNKNPSKPKLEKRPSQPVSSEHGRPSRDQANAGKNVKDLVNVFERKTNNQSPMYKNPYVAHPKPTGRPSNQSNNSGQNNQAPTRVRQDPKANAANHGARQIRDGENLRQ